MIESKIPHLTQLQILHVWAYFRPECPSEAARTQACSHRIRTEIEMSTGIRYSSSIN